jgi:hypothetical protein
MTNGAQRESVPVYTPSWFEKLVAYFAAATVVGGSLYLIIRNEPFADQNLVVLARTILSFSMAVLGATIPGFLKLSWKGGGLLVRAGGALALFVLTFTYTPNVLPLGKQNGEVPYTDLSIIDVTAEGATADVKLKNSGNDSAFLKEVRFIQRFAYAGCCSCSYAFVAPTVYEYPLAFDLNGQQATSTLPIHSLHGRGNEPDIEFASKTLAGKYTDCNSNSQSSKEIRRTNNVGDGNGNTSIYELCKSHYLGYGGRLDTSEVETIGIGLSQQVPPRGVDRFQLSFSTPEQQSLGIGDYVVVDGYAVIFYDSDKYICTPDFRLVFSGPSFEDRYPNFPDE